MSKSELGYPFRSKSANFASIESNNSSYSPNSNALVRQLKRLKETTDEAQHLIDLIGQESIRANYLMNTFNELKKSAEAAVNEALESLDQGSSIMAKPKSTMILRAQVVSQQKEMKSLLDEVSKLQHQQSAYGHKLLEYENRVNGHEGILEQSGAKARAEVKQGFDLLQERNIELYAYCKTFYWTTVNLLGAYRALSTNLMVGDIHKNDSIKESLFVTGAKQLASYGAEIARGIPMVGGVIGALDSLIECLYNTIKQNNFDNKINSINKVIQSKFGMEEDISVRIAKLAIAMTTSKEQDILNHGNISGEKDVGIQNAINYIKKKVESIKQYILPSIDLHDKNSEGAGLALVDVTMMFVYILKNWNIIVDNNKPIEEQLAIVMQNGLGALDQLMIEITEQDSILSQTNNELGEVLSYVEANGLNEGFAPTPHASPATDHEVGTHPISEQPSELIGQEKQSCCMIM